MKPVRLFYSRSQNFGDIINPILIEQVFGVPCVFASKRMADMIAIGSILQRFSTSSFIYSCQRHFLKDMHVWGTGFIDDRSTPFFGRNFNLCAIRGRQTQKLLNKDNHIPLGDPGLLFPCLLDKMPSKKYAVGLIPHVNDFQNPVFKEMTDTYKKSVVIDLSGDPMDVLKQIASCETVLSSAMHGLIAADSFGIPNQWVEVSNKVEGKGFKFRDYYSAFDIDDMKSLKLKCGKIPPKLQPLFDGYRIPADRVEYIQKQLVKSFPFKR